MAKCAASFLLNLLPRMPETTNIAIPAIDPARIVTALAQELQVRPAQVAATVALLDDGTTVPFIARYRKEATGGLDDTVLRNLEVRLGYLRELEERRHAILLSIAEQGKLTPALREEVARADTKQRLEDLYAPYKPKRRTRAQIAREAGLEPLADAILADAACSPTGLAATYVNAEVADVKAALDGARDILAERYAEDAAVLADLRALLGKAGLLYAKVVEGKEAEGGNFRDWFDFQERLSMLPSHRVLALLRGRQQGILDLRVGLDEEQEALIPHPCVARIVKVLGVDAAFGVDGSERQRWLGDVCRWTWRVKLAPAFETEFMTQLRTQAEDEAIRVFSANLKDLLLAAPAGAKAVMGLDPGIRTGVKVAVIDATGKLLDTATIYPFEPRRDVRGSLHTLLGLVAKHKPELIAIGNGTASRETEAVKQCGEHAPTPVMVSEAGASVYSASELAAQEFPDLDVSLRGAVSIARRLQDPLAELVKIEPKAIGVGQYQHDVNQRALARSLDAVVEDCVNAVGVDVNTASAPLLARISGLNTTLAHNIVAWRDANGPFPSRKTLRNVPRFGDKAFEQAAGFLRIPQGENPLDASLSGGRAHLAAFEHRCAQRHGTKAARRVARAIHRRALWSADRTRHFRRAGKTRPRSAPRIQNGHVQGRREHLGRPARRHDSGRRSHQCGELRRLRRYRRASGRPSAHLGLVGQVRPGSARRGARGADGEGQGAGSGRGAQARGSDHAAKRCDDARAARGSRRTRKPPYTAQTRRARRQCRFGRHGRRICETRAVALLGLPSPHGTVSRIRSAATLARTSRDRHFRLNTPAPRFSLGTALHAAIRRPVRRRPQVQARVLRCEMPAPSRAAPDDQTRPSRLPPAP